MAGTKNIRLLYGNDGMTVRVPADARVLEGEDVPSLHRPEEAVGAALVTPIGTRSLAELIVQRRPSSVAITISDITRPVPNKVFLPVILRVLNLAGVADSQIVIIIGTGMHRPSTPAEREILLGGIAHRVEVVDHTADRPETLTKVNDDPPVWVNSRFAKADFRIVTGYIEPHFMAGFSGGRKGVCPALVDLATVQRFHGFDTLCHPLADNGVIEGNPCHEIALKVARAVGVDFLFNVAISRSRRVAGVFCGDLEQAHRAGCRQVAQWTTATLDRPYDLVITNGGGFPLDQTFYQTVKGMCTALPALGPNSTLLQASNCGEGLGSPAYTELMKKWASDWRGFLTHIESNRGRTELDQWELQMQAKVLARIGVERLRFVSDGIPPELQKRIGVTPVLGDGSAEQRLQRAVDEYLAAHRLARVAVIPDGPYTMIRRAEGLAGMQ